MGLDGARKVLLLEISVWAGLVTRCRTLSKIEEISKSSNYWPPKQYIRDYRYKKKLFLGSLELMQLASGLWRTLYYNNEANVARDDSAESGIAFAVDLPCLSQ